MDLRHQFTVPTGIDEAWAHFQDIAGVAQCFPGGTVDSVDGESFSGQVKVKLGPIALVYHGSGRFVEKDEAAHRFVVDAQGRDKRGNGTAGATVTLTMTERGADSTAIEVLTDLAVTGKPAQFGRGVMQDVSDKLLGQFTQCLERRLASGEKPVGAGEASAASSPEVAGGDAPAAAPAAAASGGLLAAMGAPPVSAAASAPEVSGAPEESESRPAAVAASGGPLLASAAAPPVKAAEQAPDVEPRPAAPAGPSMSEPQSESDDAIDLGATVLPVLVKSYGKQIALGVGGLLVLRWLVRLLRGR